MGRIHHQGVADIATENTIDSIEDPGLAICEARSCRDKRDDACKQAVTLVLLGSREGVETVLCERASAKNGAAQCGVSNYTCSNGSIIDDTENPERLVDYLDLFADDLNNKINSQIKGERAFYVEVSEDGLSITINRYNISFNDLEIRLIRQSLPEGWGFDLGTDGNSARIIPPTKMAKVKWKKRGGGPMTNSGKSRTPRGDGRTTGKFRQVFAVAASDIPLRDEEEDFLYS